MSDSEDSDNDVFESALDENKLMELEREKQKKEEEKKKKRT